MIDPLRLPKRIARRLVRSITAVSASVALGAAFLSAASFTPVKQAGLPDYSLFGADYLNDYLLAGISSAALFDNYSISEHRGFTEDFAGFTFVERSSFLNASPATDLRANGNLLTYRVSEGDTISSIASRFGITQNTILWANNIKNSKLIRPGEEIVILPVSGVMHEVKRGETLQSIAELYGVSMSSIKTFNENIKEGETVVVPNARPLSTSNSRSDLMDVGDYLAFPVRDGWNWGRLHQSAVDISAACGTPIYAAAEGLVVDVGSPKTWNDGAGGYVRIKHPLSSLETLYAHNSKNLVTKGDYVSRGDEIGRIGNTGRVAGPTGCHVHFAVYGAKHPFAK